MSERDILKMRRQIAHHYLWCSWLCYKLNGEIIAFNEQKPIYDTKKYDVMRNAIRQDKRAFHRHFKALAVTYGELGALDVTPRMIFYYREACTCKDTVNEM